MHTWAIYGLRIHPNPRHRDKFKVAPLVAASALIRMPHHEKRGVQIADTAQAHSDNTKFSHFSGATCTS